MNAQDCPSSRSYVPSASAPERCGPPLVAGDRRLNRARGGALVLIACISHVMFGCGSPPAKNVAVAKPATDAKEDPAVRAERWRAREAAPMPEQQVSWLTGLASGRIQAEEPVKVECSEKNGVQLCSFEAFQGNDSDGDRMSIACQARTDIHRVGHILRESLGEAGLSETPQLSARLIGEGIEIGFVAETSRAGDDGSIVGTLKLSAFFTQNYSVFCWDRGVGARRTFERVVTSFLTSLSFKPHPVRPAYFAQGRVVRKGDRISGLNYTYIQKREDGEPGSDESRVFFQLETDGKSWSNKDEFRYLFRDGAGRTERIPKQRRRSARRLVGKADRGRKAASKSDCRQQV
jgi:hypothetical protein